MKSTAFKLQWMPIFLTAVWSCGVFAGGSDGGGGEPAAVEFSASVKSAMQDLKTMSSSVGLSQADLNRLSESFDSTFVMVDDAKLMVHLSTLTQDSTAENFKNAVQDKGQLRNLIKLERNRWVLLKDDNNLKKATALHECLSLIDLESTGKYPYSGKYLSLLNGSTVQASNDELSLYAIDSAGTAYVTHDMPGDLPLKELERYVQSQELETFGQELVVGSRTVKMNGQLRNLVMFSKNNDSQRLGAAEIHLQAGTVPSPKPVILIWTGLMYVNGKLTGVSAYRDSGK